MKDCHIINLFLERSEQAILELSNKYGKLFYHVAGNILNNTRDIEECLNDAYLGTWNSIPPHNPNPLSAYVCRIVRNLSIKKYQSNTAQKRNSHYDVVFEELEECIPSSSSVDSEYEAKELSLIIDRFLEGLDENNRIIFVRRYWFSDSIANIAELFHTTEHNIVVKLSRTRAKLKKYLIKEGRL